MNQLVYGSSNSFGRMSIMPLEETNWEGGEGIIHHNNPITFHNNTRRFTDWFKCLSRWYADEFWCLSVRPLDNWLHPKLNTVGDYHIQLKCVYSTSQQVLRESEGLTMAATSSWRPYVGRRYSWLLSLTFHSLLVTWCTNSLTFHILLVTWFTNSLNFHSLLVTSCTISLPFQSLLVRWWTNSLTF